MVQDVREDAATRVGAAAGELLQSFDELPTTMNVYELLGRLVQAQQVLAQAYERLADGHEKAARAAMRAEARKAEEPENPSWIAADVALREAAELARGTAEALEEAHRENGIARWFNDIAAED